MPDYLKIAQGETGTAGPANPYLDLLQSEADQQRAQSAATLSTAVDVNPDQYATSKRVAGYLGYPVAAVEARPDETGRQAKLKEIDANTAKAPLLAARYGDADFARLAHDDSGVLSVLANSFKRGWPGLRQNLSATALRANAGMLADLDRVEATLARGGAVLDSADPVGVQYMTPAQRAQYRADLGRAAGGNASTIAAAQAEKNALPSPEVVQRVMQAQGFAEAISAFMTDPVKFIASIGPESLVQNAPGLVAGAVVPGGAAARAATMGAGSFATDYGSSLLEAIGKEGVNLSDPVALAAAAKDTALMRRAAAQAMAHASVVGAVDGASGGLASKLMLPGKMLAKAPVARELANMVAQIPVQGAFGGIGEAGGEFAAGQELSPGNILAEVVGEAFSAPAEVASIVGGRMRERMAEARQAKEHAAALTELAVTAKASKLRGRDADAFAAFAKDASDNAEVFVSGATFAQSLKPEVLAALPEAITSQLPEALATGGDIAISVGDYAAHLTDVPDLVQHLRASPDAMTQAEAEAYVPDEHLRAEIDALLPIEAAPQALALQADAIAQARQTVVEALTAANRFTPAVNAQYADLIGAFISTTAERAGLDVEGIKALVPRIVSQLDKGRSTLDQLGVSSNATEQPIATPADGGPVQDGSGVRGGAGLLAEPGRSATRHARREADGSLAGLPRRVGDYVASVFPRAAEVAQSYSAARGVTYTPPATYAKVNPARAKRIADAFEAMPHDPLNREVKAAYATMIEETVAQYEAVLATGLNVEFITGADPYAGNSRAMIEDVRTNNHLWVYGTRNGFGSSVEFDPKDNPLLAETTHQISGQIALANDLFRAVHDYFGHVKEGVGFRADGEENAWRAHAAMYSPEARRAMTTETRGQNSWLNYGPHGDTNRTAKRADTIYADQKIGLLPEWVASEGRSDQQTDTAAFGQWFAGSKVVDANGSPQVVYHGTDADFNAFDPKRLGGATRHPTAKLGFYFSTSPKVASNFADTLKGAEGAQGENVLPVYLSVKAPYTMSAVEFGKLMGADGYAPVTGKTMSQLRKQLQAEGFDGIVVPGDASIPSLSGELNSDVWIAFEPEQIKSATGNDGSFDAGDPSILSQERRGAFDPSSKTIALFAQADLSTFLHESGHFFLDATVDQAARADAPAAIKADVQTLLDWFGVADIASWQAMTLDLQRESHEKFARGFERYLMEGKAPTTELQALFGRFRSWLLAVYRKLSALDVELTPEVRAVMDRMLASEAEIAQRQLQPLFDTAAAAGMTPEAFARYQATGEQATEAAIGELQGKSLRDMQFIANSKRRAITKLNAEARAKRATIEAEVTAEVYATGVYAAWRDLARGHTEDGQSIKLSLPDLKASFPELVDRIPHGLATNSDTAMPAELVADAYGLSSADELVKLLATLDKPAVVIEAETDARMLQRHGELIDARSIEQAAHAAIANDARAQVLATESNALAAAVGSKPMLARAAREFAEASVAARKVRELRPSQFTAAEARAGRDAAAAFKKGDIATAAAAKRTQVLQHVLARTTTAAVAEVDRAVDFLSKFDNAATRKAIGPEYAEQIDQLLDRVDMRTSQSLKAIDKRTSLAAWIVEQEEIGFSPVIDARLINEAKHQSYRDMTVEELRGLVDTVKNIEHLGRLKERLLTARDERSFAETVDAVAGSIVEHGGAVKEIALEGERGVKSWLQGALASHRKISSLAHQFDGGKDAGPVWSALVRPMNDAGTHEQVMIEAATLKLAELYAPIHALKGGTTGAKLFIAEIGASLSRAGRLSVALNWGNEGNRQRLMDGDHWSAAQVHSILRTLSPAELQFVNDVHAYVDSFWPEVKAQQLRVSGVVEDKVPATPWTATANDGTQVTMRGGYYPAKYDTARSAKAESHDAAQVAKDMLQGAYVRATTRRGFTKARSDEVKDRPLRKDLGVITQHITEVTHNLAWQEWLVDANRLLGSKAIDGAIRGHYGPAVVRTLKDDLQGIATADVVSGTAIDQALLHLRANVSRATMGLSFTTALMQPFGLTQSIARIGAAPVLRGLARWGGDAARLESSMSWVAEKSDFMRLRAKSFNRELTEIAGRVGGKSKAMQVVDSGLFYLTTKAQQIADIPTWIGRYEQALAQGLDEGTAVAQADQAVLSSQGGGQTKDLAELQRKHPMLTQFYSYFSVTLNLTIEKTAATDFKNPKAVAGWLADMALLSVIPAIAPAVLTALLRGDDPDKWLKKLAQWQAGYLMGMAVGVRELSGLVSGYAYSGPPVGRIVTDLGKTAQQVQQGEIDEPAVMAVVRLLGSAFGIPTVQAIRSYKGWVAWAHGDAPVSAVLMGPPSRD